MPSASKVMEKDFGGITKAGNRWWWTEQRLGSLGPPAMMPDASILKLFSKLPGASVRHYWWESVGSYLRQ
jgi:hypothetical protein